MGYIKLIDRYHYDFIVRSNKKKVNKKTYLDPREGEILLRRKSKEDGVSVNKLKEELCLAELRLTAKLLNNNDKKKIDDTMIKYEELYEKTGGLVGIPKNNKKIKIIGE